MSDYFSQTDDGRQVHAPGVPPPSSTPGTARSRLALAIVVSTLLGLGGGWFARQAPAVAHQPNLRQQARELVAEGCIPVTLVDTFGTQAQRDQVLAHARERALAYAAQYPDAVDARGLVVDLPEGGIVRERFQGAEVVGVIQMERCV